MVESLPEEYPHQYKHFLFVLLFGLWFGFSSIFYIGFMVMIIYSPTRTLPYITRFIQYFIRDIQSFHHLFGKLEWDKYLHTWLNGSLRMRMSG